MIIEQNPKIRTTNTVPNIAISRPAQKDHENIATNPTKSTSPIITTDITSFIKTNAFEIIAFMIVPIYVGIKMLD
jgi:hypothetical protein